MSTAVIYARVSSIGDRQNTDRQISNLLDYVEYQKLELCKIYEEHISGAKKNIERPVLQQAIEFCKSNRVSILLVSELSRLGRNAFEVLATVKDLIDNGVNLYMQKEQNIKFRLNSGRKLYIERGGKLGRKVGSVKTTEQKKEEHKDIISYLKRGYSVRNTAKLTNKGVSTVQRIKAEFSL